MWQSVFKNLPFLFSTLNIGFIQCRDSVKSIGIKKAPISGALIHIKCLLTTELMLLLQNLRSSILSLLS